MITQLLSDDEYNKWQECVNKGWYSDIDNINHPEDIYWDNYAPAVSHILYELYDEEKICFMYENNFISVSYMKNMNKRNNRENSKKLRIVYSNKILAANMKIRFIK